MSSIDEVLVALQTAGLPPPSSRFLSEASVSVEELRAGTLAAWDLLATFQLRMQRRFVPGLPDAVEALEHIPKEDPIRIRHFRTSSGVYSVWIDSHGVPFGCYGPMMRKS